MVERNAQEEHNRLGKLRLSEKAGQMRVECAGAFSFFKESRVMSTPVSHGPAGQERRLSSEAFGKAGIEQLHLYAIRKGRVNWNRTSCHCNLEKFLFRRCCRCREASRCRWCLNGAR